MWWSPGMLVAGLYIYVLHLFHHADEWWAWITGIIIFATIDRVQHITAKDVPDVKTKRVYTRDEPE